MVSSKKKKEVKSRVSRSRSRNPDVDMSSPVPRRRVERSASPQLSDQDESHSGYDSESDQEPISTPSRAKSPSNHKNIVSPSRTELSLNMRAWDVACTNWPTKVDAIYFSLVQVLLTGGLLGAVLAATRMGGGYKLVIGFIIIVLTVAASRYTPEYQWYLMDGVLQSPSFVNGAGLVGSFISHMCEADDTLVDTLATTLPDTLQQDFFEHMNLRYCVASFPMIDALRDIQNCAQASVECRLRLETIQNSSKSSLIYGRDAKDKIQSVLSLPHFLRLLRCTHWIREHPAYISTVSAAATVSNAQAAQLSAEANRTQAIAQQSIAAAQWLKLAKK